MRYRRIIIDGYSLIHRDAKLKALLNQSLLLARQQLIQKVERVAALLGERTTIVFDGKQTGSSDEMNASSLEILFSSADKTADTVVERLVYADANPEAVLVVTSDRRERETVMAAGAQTMSCGEFLEVCERNTKTILQKTKKNVAGPKLGDYFPPS